MRTRLVNIPGFSDNYTVAVSLSYLSGLRNASCCQVTSNPHSDNERDFVHVYRHRNFSSDPEFSVEQVGNGRFVISYENLDEISIDKLEKGLKFRYFWGVIIGTSFDVFFESLDMFRKVRTLIR